MKNRIKSTLAVVVLLGSLALGFSADRYVSQPVTLPFATLAATTATNLSSGWNTTNSTTNVVMAFNPATAAFTNSTNITTVITTNRVIIDTSKSINTGVQFSFTLGGSGVEPLYTWWAPSVDGTKFDNTNQKVISWAGQGTTEAIGTTNLAALGFGFWQLMTYSNSSARVMTNTGFSYSLNHP